MTPDYRVGTTTVTTLRAARTLRARRLHASQALQEGLLAGDLFFSLGALRIRFEKFFVDRVALRRMEGREKLLS